MFYSLGPGWGTLIVFASHNPCDEDLLFPTWLVPLINAISGHGQPIRGSYYCYMIHGSHKLTSLAPVRGEHRHDADRIVPHQKTPLSRSRDGVPLISSHWHHLCLNHKGYATMTKEHRSLTPVHLAFGYSPSSTTMPLSLPSLPLCWPYRTSTGQNALLSVYPT